MNALPGFDASLTLQDGIVLLSARANRSQLLPLIASVVAAAPLRHMRLAGGRAMSAAMTNCGALGWTADERGYRYTRNDPRSDKPWPAMPVALRKLALTWAAEAGYPGFVPDACLINAYRSGAKMSLHRDCDERDFDQPIVSVSLGATARFVFGGLRRVDPTRALLLADGDVLVWGGPARLIHHGVGKPRGDAPPGWAEQTRFATPATAQPTQPTQPDSAVDSADPLTRINLTFRQAG